MDWDYKAGGRLIWAVNHIFPQVLWFSRNQHGLCSLGSNKGYTIALLYDIKFGITLLCFVWYQHKKPKQMLKLNSWTPNSIADVAKILLIFLLWEVLKDWFLFKLILFVCYFSKTIFFWWRSQDFQYGQDSYYGL